MAHADNADTRYNTLIHEVRCVVCQNQTIADSNATLAVDLKRKIRTMVDENQSDQQIKTYLVKRYGEFILLRPRVHASTLFLWLFPLLGLLIGLGVLARRKIP